MSKWILEKVYHRRLKNKQKSVLPRKNGGTFFCLGLGENMSTHGLVSVETVTWHGGPKSWLTPPSKPKARRETPNIVFVFLFAYPCKFLKYYVM